MTVDIFNTENKYNIIYADPPWRYSNKTCRGGCDKHYNTMTFKDICNLPIKKISEKDSILFLWVTYPMLQEGLELIEAWGYKYKTIGFQWVKKCKKADKYFYGVGYWTRSNTECCLIGIKGKPKKISNSISQLIVEPVQKHSKKPDSARDKIVKLMGDIPKIELFARTEHTGWDNWGNEIEAKSKIKSIEELAYTE